MKELTAGDYTLTFEAAGVIPLISEIDIREYMPGGSVILGDSKTTRSFMLKKTIEREGSEGIEVFSQLPFILPERFEKAIIEAEVALKDESSVQSAEGVDRTLVAMRAVAHAYSAFDSVYLDAAYELRESVPALKENLAVVERERNSYREEINRVFFDADSLFCSYLRKLAIRFEVPYEDLEWYEEADLKALFKDRTMSVEALATRRSAYIFTKDEEGTIEYFEGEEAQKRIALLSSSAPSIPTLLKGRTANGRGVVTGTVKVIHTDYGDYVKLASEMRSMEQGQILVSETTAPELMEACRKAGAIVTDLGGMLSHAAITSRELGIPCLVGVVNASKTLKDGDIVEVDADTGIVRKI